MTDKRLIYFGTLCNDCQFREMHFGDSIPFCRSRMAHPDSGKKYLEANERNCPIWAQLETLRNYRMSSHVHDVDDFYREVEDE